MKKKSLVSIIIPVYNVRDYVGKCLKSVMEQVYENLEILVIDDGSTDGSGELCEKLVAGDKRARVLHKKNGGLSDARNYGIGKSKGEYIVLVDGDDYVSVNFVQKMYEAIEKSGAEVAVCGYDEQVPKAGIMSGEEATIQLLISQDNTDIVAWNKMYKRELFRDIKYPVGEKHEDTLTTYKILARTKSVVYVAEPLYHYVKREGSIMNTESVVEGLRARERAAKESIEYFNDEKNLKLAAEVSLLLAKYAYVDAGVHGKLDSQELCGNALSWIKSNKNNYKTNQYMTKKLRLYNKLVDFGIYKLFRKIL